MDINDSDCDNSNAKLEEESLKLIEPKTVDFVQKQGIGRTFFFVLYISCKSILCSIIVDT